MREEKIEELEKIIDSLKTIKKEKLTKEKLENILKDA